MTEPSRATIFGRDAAAYEQARPGYPDEVISHVVDLARPERAVEVGAGTGKATVSVARPGLDLVCLEPSPEMAGVLEARSLPGVRVVRATFEEWEPGESGFDLIYAAQAWHWVDPAIGLAKARRIMRDGGVVSLLWNRLRHRYEPFAEIYERHAPQILAERDERIRRRDHHDWLIDLAEAGFTDLERFTHEWSVELTATELTQLYSTYSDHMMLHERTRRALLEDLAAEVETRGGRVLQQYATDVFSGRN